MICQKRSIGTTVTDLLTTHGITNDRNAAGGVMFVVARVAQAVADAFPDQKVIRFDGSVIAPSANKPPAAKQPKP